MGIALVEEVLDFAPAELSAGERLVLVVVAQNANDVTREGWPGMDKILHRTGMTRRGVTSALQQLRDRGLELRVAIGTDKAGRPVFAHKGAQTKYRIPRLAPDRTAPPEETQWVPEDVPIDEQRVRTETPIEPERVRQEVPKEEERVSEHVPFDPQRVRESVPMGTSTRTPSLQVSSKEKPDLDLNWPSALQHPEPLRTIVASLEVTSPGATLDEARGILRMVVARHKPKGVPYYRTIAANGGFGAYLGEVREARQRETEQRLAELRRTELPCEHDEPAGRSLHPVRGTPLCPRCRMGLPAPDPAGSPDTPPEVRAVISAYRAGVTGASRTLEIPQLLLVTRQAKTLLGQGLSQDDLALVAEAAGAEGVDLPTYATRTVQAGRTAA